MAQPVPVPQPQPHPHPLAKQSTGTEKVIFGQVFARWI